MKNTNNKNTNNKKTTKGRKRQVIILKNGKTKIIKHYS